jgi:hypothetical protein
VTPLASLDVAQIPSPNEVRQGVCECHHSFPKRFVLLGSVHMLGGFSPISMMNAQEIEEDTDRLESSNGSPLR